jgi:hypothetical protein
MQTLVIGDLHIEVRDGADSPTVQLVWTGKCNTRHISEALAPYFREALAAASARNLPLELRLEQVEQLGSPAVASIIELISASRARSIKLTLVYDRAREWQRLSFDALRVVARDQLVEVRAA